ncbi:hypothetical protein LTS08_004641 [Lithohypha guttulata]|nr:hypothetical protein LTS08_004641 [Lithohypha guttulata]
MADIKICWQHKRDSVVKLVLSWLERILGQEYASYMGRDGHALLEAANEPDTTENNHEDGISAGGRAHHRGSNIVAALDERMRMRRSRTRGSTVRLRKASSSSVVASASFRPEASLFPRASPSGISAPELSSLSNDTSVQRWLDQLPDEEPPAPAAETPSSYHTAASETSSDPAACYVCGKGILRDTSTFTCGGCGQVGHAEHILMHHWFNSLRGPRWQCRTCHWQAVPP